MGGYSKIKAIITTECKNKTHSPSSPTDLTLNLPAEHLQQKQTTEPAEDKTKSEPTTGETDWEKTHDVNESNKSVTETNPSPSSDEEQSGGGQGRDNNYDDDGCRAVNGGEVKLKRNSSTATYRFMRFDKQGNKNGGGRSSKLAIQGAVRRAFSLRRSSSVSERYSRIYDRSVTVTSPIGDEDQELGNETDEKSGTEGKSRKKSSSNKIIRACKRILGL